MITPEDLVGFVATSEMTPDERLQLLKVSTSEQIEGDEVLIREGDRASDFFLLLSGSLTVVKGRRSIATLERGSICGEMALFND